MVTTMCKIPIDENKALLRTCLSQFPTGVAVVTAQTDQDQPIGMTISSFNSLSLTPALIAWCIDCRSASYRYFCEVKKFAITFLAENQQEIAKRFATQGCDKFAGLNIDPTQPIIIPGGSAWLECQIESSLLVGDHRMIIGKVLACETTGNQPLVFCQSQFLSLSPKQGHRDKQAA